ncbi:MAG TPA: thiamine-phosphate kinase [Burkholderiales bacterium]|nr:thiamine-phosphate kinase [Burkholderiales bacterium]
MPSEFELIAKYFTRPARTAALGVGDDCALVRPPAGLVLALTTDTLAEGTHFLPGAEPRRLGHKSLAVNLSDLAAMGADPRWFLLAIALPDVDEAWLEAFAAGIFALAEAHAIELIGGDTTRGPRTITITAIGTLPPGYALRRDAAQAGDDVWLSGSTGDAALGLAHLEGKIALAPEAASRCVARLEQPAPRVALGQRLRGVAAAAIDVSDGLLADLGHILERSKLAAEIDYEHLPRSPDLRACADAALADKCLLAGGDDYELVFTAAADRRAAVEAAGRAANVAVTRIGRILAGAPEVRLLDRAGRRLRVEQPGFDHFR